MNINNVIARSLAHLKQSLKKFRDRFLAQLGLTRIKELSALEKKLEICSATSDYLFDLSFSDYILEEIFERAERVKQTEISGKLHTKRFRNRFGVSSGLTKKQAFFLELDCLSRIAECCDIEAQQHFPILIDYDTEQFTITTSHNGISLKDIREVIAVPDFNCQLSLILSTLSKAQVAHLDCHPNGKNLTVSNEGIISLIDFDNAQVKDQPFNHIMRNRYENNFQKTKEKMVFAVVNCKFLILK
ncbi:hypothetical protein [Roseinatronobacter bogoriensis]|uniref:Protein kinase domain-containing protein n=1 Tax=Roseinatronobacter bogoriensis subsp. barguzinensis TaxID=441209 RepID=A0A2K8KE67_9RHOB|nr:hypothetical protein [Rhodobaca]ATX65068.1 hypothetical protein BG454_03845 [Rhodobaca barguzinensis]MBB4209548.1 hypothetical protein [Rhodobaca bogoriensis DSM 18756]TDW35460.1 hypothetical protein LY39_03180 [Rhodobaca barguzinensis]TDY66671.1 hypothetical protein EV660_110121 [Rhodobaca bogoriensis DSM 18756]